MTLHTDKFDKFDVIETDPLMGDAETKLNRATVSGKDSPEWQALLARPMTFVLPKDRNRDARQTDWKNSPAAPFRAWVEGGPAGALTEHAAKKSKGYFPIVFGEAAGTGYVRRTANGMKTVEFVGIDVDSGDDYDAALDRVEAEGLACVAYTSFRDGAEKSKVKRDTVLRALKLDREPTNAELRSYLAAKLRPEILDTVEIDGQDHDEDGVQIVYRHAPLRKYRLLFPLAQSLPISTLAMSQREQQARYARMVRGLAHKLGLLADEACFDVSRVFYMPSHPPGGVYALDVIRGRGLTLADMPEREKSGGLKNAFEMAGAGIKTDDREIGGMPILKWAAKYAHRLEIGNLLQDYAPDKVRKVNGDIIVVECPFDEWHSNAGDLTDTGCHVQNADAANGFVWGCKHGCKDTHDRLDMLHKALVDGWFDESHLLPGDYVPLSDEEEKEDGDDSEDAPAIADKVARHADAALSTRDELLSLVEDFDTDTTAPEVAEVIGQAIASKAGEDVQTALKLAIAAKTLIQPRGFNSIWKAESKAAKARQKRKPKGHANTPDIPAASILDHYPDQVEYAKERIVSANADNPRIFQYMDSFAVVDGKNGRVRLLDMKDELFTELGKVTRWEKVTDEDEVRHVSPPDDVVKAVFNDYDFRDSLPEIAGVVTTPFFAADGSLVIEPGYHEGAKVYLAPGDLVLPGVSRAPTPEEVTEAKRLLIEEVIADFPLAGMSRREIMAATGETAAPVAHVLAYMLLPFCRDMIDGPTPGHVFTKPEAGTGASLLDDICAMIDDANPTPALVPPKRPEELGKTLTGALKDGPRRVRFDNVGDTIHSPELASAMTAPVYGARILGRSQIVDVKVRCVWGFTANNFEASRELLRRLIFIPLDAKSANPEERKPDGGWRHKNVRVWVREHRAELVGACLTLIQNWVCQGMVKQEDVTRASYEEWAGVMGGILKAAGIDGFLMGQEGEQAKARDSAQDGMQLFMDALAEFGAGTIFRPGSATVFGKDKAQTVSLQAVLNGTKRAGEKGDAKAEPILIAGMGYDRVSGLYENSGGIGKAMKRICRKPWKSGEVELTFTELADRGNGGTGVYRMDVLES